MHPHICFDKRTMHLSHPYQPGQNSDAAFFIRQSKTVPRTVNTMVSETDSDQSLSPGPSHICIKQHPKQFGSEMNLLESPVPPQATQCVFLQFCVISNHLTQVVSKWTGIFFLMQKQSWEKGGREQGAKSSAHWDMPPLGNLGTCLFGKPKAGF